MSMHPLKELQRFIVELSQRLADDPDYDSYLRPRLEAVLKIIEIVDMFPSPRDEASGNVTGAKPQ